MAFPANASHISLDFALSGKENNFLFEVVEQFGTQHLTSRVTAELSLVFCIFILVLKPKQLNLPTRFFSWYTDDNFYHTFQLNLRHLETKSFNCTIYLINANGSLTFHKKLFHTEQMYETYTENSME